MFVKIDADLVVNPLLGEHVVVESHEAIRHAHKGLYMGYRITVQGLELLE